MSRVRKFKSYTSTSIVKNCFPWPFAKWGIDILGPFPLGRGQTKFMIVAVDYFTKWIEAEALTKIIA